MKERKLFTKENSSWCCKWRAIAHLWIKKIFTPRYIFIERFIPSYQNTHKIRTHGLSPQLKNVYFMEVCKWQKRKQRKRKKRLRKNQQRRKNNNPIDTEIWKPSLFDGFLFYLYLCHNIRTRKRQVQDSHSDFLVLID